jgi:hypothetical protein
MNRVASLPEFRQHRHDTVEQCLAGRILLSRLRPAHLQDVLHGTALQRGTTRNLEIAPSITVGGFAVAFGNVQGDRLRSA